MSMSFSTEPGFCPRCGSILPELGLSGGVTCYTCKQEHGPEAFGKMESYFVIHFNSLDTYKNRGDNSKVADGPVVERKCPKCNNNQMSYSTLQLRSADEGQTVFYTCTNCKYKETENS